MGRAGNVGIVGYAGIEGKASNTGIVGMWVGQVM